jgi:hypothetical protein
MQPRQRVAQPAEVLTAVDEHVDLIALRPRLTALVTGIDSRDVPEGVHRLEPGIEVRRADEIGIFRLGSTAVLFFEKGVVDRWVVSEGPVRFGEPLAARAGAKTNGAGGSAGPGGNG